MNSLLRSLVIISGMATALPIVSFVSTSRAAEIPVYIGTYTKAGGAQGIYFSRYDTETGKVSTPDLAVATKSPSFLVVHPNGKSVYAVNEEGGGSVSAFAVDPGGKLHEINREQSLGNGPTHLAIDREGKNVLVANYGGGSIAVLPVAEDGSVRKVAGFIQHKGTGPDPKRQEGPHAHSVYFDATNAHVFTCDLGLDKIFIYRFNPAESSLSPADPPFASTAPGAGPRHLAFSAKGDFVYCVNEMANTVTVFAREGTKAILKEVQTISTLPSDFKGNSSTAEIMLHPNGKYLYVSNRGHDSIATFNVDADTGKLTAAGYTPTQGAHPRYFGIDPAGKFLVAANRDSNNIVSFRIDDAGKLTHASTTECQSPVCLLFVP